MNLYTQLKGLLMVEPKKDARLDNFGPDGGLRIRRGDISGYLMPARLDQ